MPRFDDVTDARAKALIKELVEAGFLPKAMFFDSSAQMWEIICKHIAAAEGKATL